MKNSVLILVSLLIHFYSFVPTESTVEDSVEGESECLINRKTTEFLGR